MELIKIVKYLDKKYSPHLAAKWDNPGFQVFNKQEIQINRDINKVVVCLDVNEKVVKQAINEQADLIISRHPFIFNDLKQELKIKKDLIKSLTESNILVYSIHTNYDASPNQGIIELLEKNFDLNKNKRFGKDKEGFEIRLKNSIDSEEFIELMNKTFDTGICQISSSFNIIDKIQNFYIVSGAGGSSIIEERLKDSVMVTGEIKWNELIYANDNNVSVLILGHYMENYFVDDIANRLSNAFKNELDINRIYIGNQLKEYK